jgi:hypothetical protein
VHLGYFAQQSTGMVAAQQSTGMVKTGLPTQILKNHFNTLKVKAMVYKGPRTFFKRIPKFAFLGEKSSNLATNFLGPARQFFPVQELFEDNCLYADGGFPSRR